MMLVLIFIENLIMVRFIMLKSIQYSIVTFWVSENVMFFGTRWAARKDYHPSTGLPGP